MKSRRKHGITNCLNQKGFITPLILVIASVFIIFGVSLINWAVTEHKDTTRNIRRVQSLQVAEAGVNYYKWHLAHDSSDYMDGNSWCCNNDPVLTLADCGNVCGLYVHEYKDYDDNIIGEFSLQIIPSETGSTINTIKSTGYAYGNNSIKKKVTARVGKRSLAEYSFLSNDPLIFSSTSTVSGPVHSNGAIEFNGTCSAEVTSSVSVTGSGGPVSFWRAPVLAIDFSLFTVSLGDIKADAIANGIYFGDNAQVCGDGVCDKTEDDLICLADCLVSCGNDVCNSGETNITCPADCSLEGFLVEFKTDATVDIYSVDSLESPLQYWHYPGWNPAEAEEIQNKTLLGNYAIPSNGLIFIENDIWVEGTVNGRVTLAAARFPENLDEYTKIWINDNVQYLARDGNHNLGLITQGDILIPRHAPTDLTIDATLLSQYGKGLYFRYYKSNIVKDSIENYGGIITYLRSGVKYGNPVVNGYVNSSYIYNNNLTFSPPPSFPTSENFEILSWTEE